jgi:hypothetical protein
MEELLSMVGPFLLPGKQMKSRSQLEAVAIESTAFARYRKTIANCG